MNTHIRFWTTIVLVLSFASASVASADEEETATVNRTDRGPDVVLRETEERTIYEYRQQGRLTMIKVVPKVGRPYFLVPADRSENFGDIDRSTRLIPQWVIREF